MHVSPSIFYKRLPHIQKYVTIKILPEQQHEWWTQTICWFFSPSKLVKADKNCQTEPQLNQLQSMHLWLAKHVFTAFVIYKRTADCNWQMSGNDRKFLNHNKSNHIIRGNKYRKNNGENNQSHIWKKTRQNFTSVISRSLNLTPKLSNKVKRKQNKDNIQNSNEKCYFARWCGCPLLLCSGKSFIQHGRDRLATGFTTREETTVREKTQNEKNKRLKNKKHHGPFNSYNINKEALENKLASMSLNRPINWTRLE